MAVETMDYMKAAERFIRAAGKRAADADEVELAALWKLHEAVDEAVRVAVMAQREQYGRSWAWIAEPLGMTRQGAQQRYMLREDQPATPPQVDALF